MIDHFRFFQVDKGYFLKFYFLIQSYHKNPNLDTTYRIICNIREQYMINN